MDVSTGGGTVEIDLDEPAEFPYTKTYNEGTIVSVKAVPSFGYVFNGWENSITGTDNPEFIVMDCNKQISASFSVNWRLVGTFIGSLVMIIFLAVVLIIRRRSPAVGAE